MDELPVNSELVLTMHLGELRKIFRPAAPVDDPAIFRGRADQLRQCVAAVEEPGRHAVIFGERGVGKTSLAYMAAATFTSMHGTSGLAVRLQCSADSTFASVWQDLPHRLGLALAGLPPSEHPLADVDIRRLFAHLHTTKPAPQSVGRALEELCMLCPLLITLDEFDLLTADRTQPFSDLVKYLSDNLVGATILLVGVAESLEGLILGHASIDRGLRQIPMPRMSRPEIQEIVDGGYVSFNERTGERLRIDSRALDAVVGLSEGFPYYAHLLALALGDRVLTENREEITHDDVIPALLDVTNETSHSIRTAYVSATASARSDATFGLTLLACAFARQDTLGYFAPMDVAEGASTVGQTARSSASIIGHIKRFTNQPPHILESRGAGRSRRYRFTNPLMKPFILMEAIRNGLIRLPSSDPEETGVPGSDTG